mgnify:FL=1
MYVSELKHDAKEQTVVLQDVTADPTLPRTQEVTCPQCQHNEAVFFSASSEQVRLCASCSIARLLGCSAGGSRKE